MTLRSGEPPQTIRAQVQLVLVGPTLEVLAVPDDVVAGFHPVKRVSLPGVPSLGEATAAGIWGSHGTHHRVNGGSLLPRSVLGRDAPSTVVGGPRPGISNPDRPLPGR